MLYCSKCKHIYGDEEVIYAETEEYAVTYCPVCHNDELEDTEQCGRCRNEVAPRTLIDVTEQNEGKPLFVCADCYDAYYFVEPEGDK